MVTRKGTAYTYVNGIGVDEPLERWLGTSLECNTFDFSRLFGFTQSESEWIPLHLVSIHAKLNLLRWNGHGNIDVAIASDRVSGFVDGRHRAHPLTVIGIFQAIDLDSTSELVYGEIRNSATFISVIGTSVSNSSSC